MPDAQMAINLDVVSTVAVHHCTDLLSARFFRASS